MSSPAVYVTLPSVRVPGPCMACGARPNGQPPWRLVVGALELLFCASCWAAVRRVTLDASRYVPPDQLGKEPPHEPRPDDQVHRPA